MAEMMFTYHNMGGLLYPEIELPKEQEEQLAGLGKYGRMAMKFMKENDRVRYNSLYRFGRLGKMMQEAEKEANELLLKLTEDYRQKHRPQNPNSFMEMLHINNQAQMQAEEVVIRQMVIVKR